jgi:hypothetical protein
MGVTFLHFSCSIMCQEISSGARSALPMGVAPEAIVKKTFSSIGSKYSVVHHTSTRDTLITSCHRIRVHHFREKVYSPFLKIVAPKARTETPSYTVLCTYFALVGAIFLLSYIIFFMTSMNTSLCMSANRFMGSTVIFAIFDR